MSKAISILYLLKLHVIAENGADLIDKRLVECHPVTALCLILHIDMLIIDGASHLVFNELGCEIYSLVAGLEIFKELYRLQVQQHLVGVDNPSGGINTLQLLDIAVGLSDSISHSKPRVSNLMY